MVRFRSPLYLHRSCLPNLHKNNQSNPVQASSASLMQPTSCRECEVCIWYIFDSVGVYLKWMNIPLRAPRALRHQSPERRERTGGQAAEQCATIWSHLPMPLPASGQLVTRRKTNRNQSKEQLSSSPSSSSLSSNRADHEDSNEIPGGRLCVYTLFFPHAQLWWWLVESNRAGVASATAVSVDEKWLCGAVWGTYRCLGSGPVHPCGYPSSVSP